MADVAVIGAGLSGLVAARRLTSVGLVVSVLEGGGRVGGRTLGMEVLPGVVVDAGAQWIGPTQTRVTALCEELGVARFPSAWEGRAVTVRRGRRSEGSGSLGGSRPHEAADFLQLAWRLDRLPRQLGSARRRSHLDARTLGGWARRRAVTSWALDMLDGLAQSSFGRPSDQLSLLGVAEHLRSCGGLERLTGARWALAERIEGGTAELSHRLAAELGDRVVLDTRVLRLDRGEGHVDLQCDRGRAIRRVRRVIVATDPASAAAIEHRPPLPSERRALERGWQQGSGVKAFAGFAVNWWRPRGLSGTSSSDSGVVRFTFDASPRSGPAGVLGMFLDSGLSPGDESELRRAVTTGLRSVFGADMPDPDGFVAKDWADERLIAGCVPGVGPGVLSRAGDALRRPVGPIHWAGAESSEEWDGHLEGAVRAGERAADEVLACLHAPDR